MTVPAGISPVNANTCAAVRGVGVVDAAAISLAVAGGDIATVELFLVLIVGVGWVVVAVLVTEVLVTAVVGELDTVCVVLLIVEILTITPPNHFWLCLSQF